MYIKIILYILSHTKAQPFPVFSRKLKYQHAIKMHKEEEEEEHSERKI